MRILKFTAMGIVVLLVVGVFVAPIGPVPGFFIGGTPSDVPDAWPDTSRTHEIRLKVPGTLPRVVTIWVIEHGGDLHVVGAPDSGWVTRLGDGGPVQMRLGDATYDLVATRVTENWRPVVEAYVAKYEPDYPEIVAGFPSPQEAEGQFALFRLERSG